MMTNTTDVLPVLELENLGNVTSDYRHASKFIKPAPGIALSEAYLKWYDIARPEAGVPGDIAAMARNYLQDEASSQNLSLGDALGFVILHRCGDAFYFLIVCTWRNDNEIWETVYAKVSEEDPGFRPFPTEGPHRPTYCVWELGAVWHEKLAWSRYLNSPRDADAKQLYLQDSYEGLV
jgi:hypothetical protein